MNLSSKWLNVTVDGCWGDETGAPCVLLSGGKETEGRLRPLLFAWHKPSWYGADIEELRVGGRSLLKLTPLQAVGYLSQPQPVRLLRLQWSARVQTLIGLAEAIEEALTNGWFEPDWNGWTEEKRSWRIAYPAEQQPRKESWERLLREAAAAGDGGAAAWLGEALEEMIASDEAAARAWGAVVSSAGESVVRHKAADEQDWLVAIGFREDPVPFRVALQLVEPDEERGWTLRPALRDKEGAEWLPVRSRPAAPGWEPESGAEAAAALPAHWLPYVEERLRKERDKWAKALPERFGEPVRNGDGMPMELSEQEAWHFLEHGSVALLEAGCPVLLPGWWEAVRSRRLRLRAKIKSSVGSAAQPMFGLDGIVQFDWKLALGGIDLTEEQFMKLAEEQRRLIRIGGEWVHLDPRDAERIRQWLGKAGKRKGMTLREVLELHLRGGMELEADEEREHALRAEVELNEHLAEWLEQLQHISDVPTAEVPAEFLGELRPYQLQGVSWLLFLRRFGLGGVLADDMGLGKTIQFMAYLLCVKRREPGGGPSLLICPTSVMGNWEKELNRFAPSLRVMLHYGAKRHKDGELAVAAAGADLVITSYALAQLDEEELCGVEWNALCLDEAQNIKNAYTKQSGAIRRLRARHRIALTGTPMENRLTELWSIYDFINPGYLGSLGEFRKAVVAPIERTRDETMIAGLQRWVKPFMLRRVKKDPAIQLSLPEKLESKSYIALTAEQGAMYENIVSDLLAKLDELDPMARRGLILATLTKLKQLCDHPSLIQADEKGAVWEPQRSNKAERLLEMMEEIAAEGDKCLIFTQYVEMGRQLQRMLRERLGSPVPYLHGGVPKAERDGMIASFQSGEDGSSAFVLSLKAGGTGLNLTAANHVVHFDRWWNPAVENQATDRAFRIGQTKRVQVHKFVTLGTLEEKIDEMIESKQSLNEQIVGRSESWITELSTNELRELFALRDNWLKG